MRNAELNNLITIGTPVPDDARGVVQMDLEKLIGHRLLVQAASGGGKSYLLRVFCEQAGPRVQTLVLDPEGEFASLREKLDMVLVGSGGEVPADPKNAKALARRLLELKTSAVLDIYELPRERRHLFVADFLASLMDAPRALWRPLLVIVDEAHVYCPERGQGESPATGAVLELLSRGRKRGFCGILATQRLSKLHKSAAGECNNLIIGRTNPIDQERAADLLGIPRSERRIFSRLSVGEWFGTGPAFASVEAQRFLGLAAQTRHPEAGRSRSVAPPAPSAAIAKVAGELADLARREDAEPLTLEDAAGTITRLRRELKAAQSAGPTVDRTALETMHAQGIALGRKAVDREWGRVVETVRGRLTKAGTLAQSIAQLAASNGIELPNEAKSVAVPGPHMQPTLRDTLPKSRTAGEKIPKAARLILTALAHHPGWSKTQVAVLCGYAEGGGGFGNALGALRSRGWVDGTAEQLHATDAGLAALGPIDPLPEGRELLEYWKRNPRIGKAERLILDALANGEAMTKEALAQATGYAVGGGGFGNALGRLRTLQLVSGKSLIELAEVLR